jgi:type II secretory pathway component PulK
MTRYSRRGVAMILVIMLIGLMGITLATLGHSCRLMLAQTELQRQGAVDRSLVLSGLAWAKRRIQNSELRTQEAVTLDVNDLAAGARLAVAIVDANDAGRTIHVTTFIPSAHYDLNRSRTFRVSRP